MISTVTATTVSTITGTPAGFAASLGLIGVLALLALLLHKELATALPGPGARILGRVLDVAIVPLLIAFALIAVIRVAEALH
jgi:hypothetical protein